MLVQIIVQVIVRVTKEFLEQMNQIVKPHRPDHRLSAVIDEKAPYAFLLPDITLFPNFISMYVGW